MGGNCQYTLLPIIAALLPFTSVPISDQILQYGIWTYLLIFVVITFTSTVIGGPVPDSTFLILIGAAAIDNSLSIPWLFVMAAGGGFTGYEINYWSGRLFGYEICRGVCPTVLHDRNVRKALDTMNRFGPAALVISRFMPVLNLPSFIAGVNGMEYHKYVAFNLISSAIWCGTLLTLGYYIGSVAIINQYLDDLTDLFFVLMAVAIVVVLVMFIRDYVNRKDNRFPERE